MEVGIERRWAYTDAGHVGSSLSWILLKCIVFDSLVNYGGVALNSEPKPTPI